MVTAVGAAAVEMAAGTDDVESDDGDDEDVAVVVGGAAVFRVASGDDVRDDDDADGESDRDSFRANHS